jgi:hypothetical protein
MIAVPGATAVTVPPLLTVAMVKSQDDQVTAAVGETATVKFPVVVPLTESVSIVGDSVIFSAAIPLRVTLMVSV